MGACHPGLALEALRCPRLIVDIINFAKGVVIGVLIVGSVYALIYLAWNAIIDAYEAINKH